MPPRLGVGSAYMTSQGVPTDKGDRASQPDRTVLIAAEKVRIQYRNMPTAFVGSAVICSLMGFALATGAGLPEKHQLDVCCVRVGHCAVHPMARIQQNQPGSN